MDRNEALRLLTGGSEGVAEWNRRPKAGGEIPPLREADLRGAHLSGADLRGAHLGKADLGRAALGGADLREAHLGGAHLVRANLGRADLRGAHLILANLVLADLDGANLSGADLDGADLREASLGGADLDRARCRRTNFADVDLSEIKGLESIQHDGPSTVGIDTLVRSRGKIPEAFLRGCGVPEVLVTHLPSLIGAMSPIQFSWYFLSYSSKDEAFAQRLHARMSDEGLRVWLAPEDVPGGKKPHEPSDEAIRFSDSAVARGGDGRDVPAWRLWAWPDPWRSASHREEFAPTGPTGQA
ncbi:MAG: toll/interleukin-1 receptor domain-containing protein [Planctomycetaceae bacterium]|nr:toll/interleukin-1 receptor domain-containing protein [Planctomycetaceae bacterium]MBV8609084.1 toll/interleukin-1 receptor domain-containing protein [Singulisphaera sp.]MBV8268134.1 toll/interleukin-1 receptor domain-containing protein [Planctomycetaceae bacterium]MBV8318797.1 toll/interleukin-1 receptor domain-containing protein [Planctomycetaceae bacterium]MBV8381056.1 toll/interleukin-1 receptor domain-containing protein [Planctomycetaceae bacterium]